MTFITRISPPQNANENELDEMAAWLKDAVSSVIRLDLIGNNLEFFSI